MLKTIIDKLIKAIYDGRFDRALDLTKELEGAVGNMCEGNWENIPTPLLDSITLKDHKRTLILHGELLLLNCSVVRIQRLREYIRKYIKELKHGEAQKNG